MSFFFNDARAEAKARPKPKPKLKDIPVRTLTQMGCGGCPRDAHDQDLTTPKMWAQGPKRSRVFLLTAAPGNEEDRRGEYMHGQYNDEIARLMGEGFVADLIISGIVQCAGDHIPDSVEIACCRNRVVQDIEDAEPDIIITVGDPPLAWATGFTNALQWRGTLIPAKIGKHSCWVYPILYPNYVEKKRRGPSEYELVLATDIRRIKKLLRDDITPPVPFDGKHDEGIEIITGQEPGDMQRLERALQELAQEARTAVDIETNGLRPFFLKDPKMWCAAVGTYKRTVAFSLDHPDGWGSDAQRRRAHALFFEYMWTSGVKLAHNLSFELEWFGRMYGEEIFRRTEWGDTMVAADITDERSGTKSLDVQCRLHFGFFLKALSRVDPKQDLLQYPLRELLRYNGLDTKWTHRLFDSQQPLLDEANYREQYHDKVALAITLVKTEIKGMPVDYQFAREAGERLDREASEVIAKLDRTPEVLKFRASGNRFVASSDDDVLRLMKFMNRDEVQGTNKKTGEVRWTTDEEALSSMPRHEVPSAPLILELRGIQKLNGTYVQPIISGANVCPDGKVRSKYSSMRAVTGRLAAEDPAVQNWPKRKHKWVRAMIRAWVNQWLVALDYGQIEFRVVGMASHDKNLVKYCWTGYDVHKVWAEEAVSYYPKIKDWIVEEFGVDWDEKGLKTLRQEMKNKWVFPQLFGSSTMSCARNLHLPDDVAEDMGAQFWDEFAGVKRWQETVLDGYRKNLYVETLGGRRRRGAMTPNEAINLPIQGTAAEIVCTAMTALSVESEILDDPELQPALNVHDDLTSFLSDQGLMGKIDHIARIMCKPRFDYINVPLVVEASIGPNWADLEEIKVYRSHEMFSTPNPYE